MGLFHECRRMNSTHVILALEKDASVVSQACC